MLNHRAKISVITLAIGLFYGIAMAQTAEDVVTVKDPIYSFQLTSNATTGYSWQVSYYDKKLLTLKEHHYIAPDTSHMTGVPGYEMWQFKATPYAFRTAPHRTTIKMIYVRAWEKDAAPVSTKNITLKISR